MKELLVLEFDNEKDRKIFFKWLYPLKKPTKVEIYFPKRKEKEK